MNPISKPALLLASAFSTGAYLTLAGCSNGIAPESTPTMTIGEKTAANSTSLLAGREVLMTRCAACHRAPSVEKYSAEEWRGIVGRMSPLAKLNASQQAQLLAYVLTAKETKNVAPASRHPSP